MSSKKYCRDCIFYDDGFCSHPRHIVQEDDIVYGLRTYTLKVDCQTCRSGSNPTGKQCGVSGDWYEPSITKSISDKLRKAFPRLWSLFR